MQNYSPVILVLVLNLTGEGEGEGEEEGGFLIPSPDTIITRQRGGQMSRTYRICIFILQQGQNVYSVRFRKLDFSYRKPGGRRASELSQN